MSELGKVIPFRAKYIKQLSTHNLCMVALGFIYNWLFADNKN
jgi:hypothetical protein